MDDPGDDSEWPFEGSHANTPHRRGWPWVIGLIIVVMVVCGGAVLALNAWVGRELDKTATQPAPAQKKAR
ncbi:hypothetical protein [Paractinoplanes maris]|uniref:hypothetical protein n=1 Tax=Paractinoplanes maris TaxID=1734446 RepID=UPI002021D3AB|nr:hypothetical protein [Actinoplanes maris]